MNVLVINCGSSSLKQKKFWQKVSVRESELTEDWYTRKQDATKKSQKLPCRHIKKPSRWFWMP